LPKTAPARYRALRDGGFMVVAKAPGQVLVQSRRPGRLDDADELLAVWDGG